MQVVKIQNQQYLLSGSITEVVGGDSGIGIGGGGNGSARAPLYDVWDDFDDLDELGE